MQADFWRQCSKACPPKDKMEEIEEREEQVRIRGASIRLAYMKLLETTKGMELILESLNK
jgi:hypothetical protein